MITQKIHKIKILEVEALTTKAYTEKGATYDKEKGELTFTANKAEGKAFRLIHDNKKAFVVDGTDGTVTSSLYTIEEFVTEKETLNRIEALNLKYDPPAPESKGAVGPDLGQPKINPEQPKNKI